MRYKKRSNLTKEGAEGQTLALKRIANVVF